MQNFSVAVVYIKSKDAFLLLKRSTILKKSPGDICFPGGKFETSLDKSIVCAAIRETEEETSIKLSEESYICFLSEYTTSRNEVIEAHGFFIDEMPDIILSEESEDIILLPKNFISKQNFENNNKAKKHKYKLLFQNNCIWGVTASILFDLIDNFFI